MIEGKFYANRFNKKVEILENAGIRMGLGEKYLLRRLSQQYAYHCLRKDFEEESEKLKLWETALSKGRTKKEMLISDGGLHPAQKGFGRDYFYPKFTELQNP